MSSTDSDRYDIFFAGESLEGKDPQAVREALGRLFKADDATLDRLFSGRRQRIKGNCDSATALKYQKAITAAGGKVAVVRVEPEVAAEASAPGQTSPDHTAAVPQVPSQASSQAQAQSQAPSPNTAVEGSADSKPFAEEPPTQTMSLAPAGSDVLRPEERQVTERATLSLDHLSVAEQGEPLNPTAAETVPTVEPPSFEVAEVGSDLGPAERPDDPELPDVSALSLAPEGGDLSDCTPSSPEVTPVDLSHLDLAEAGSDLLQESERRRTEATAPDTSHLSVDDS